MEVRMLGYELKAQISDSIICYNQGAKNIVIKYELFIVYLINDVLTLFLG